LYLFIVFFALCASAHALQSRQDLSLPCPKLPHAVSLVGTKQIIDEHEQSIITCNVTFARNGGRFGIVTEVCENSGKITGTSSLFRYDLAYPNGSIPYVWASIGDEDVCNDPVSMTVSDVGYSLSSMLSSYYPSTYIGQLRKMEVATLDGVDYIKLTNENSMRNATLYLDENYSPVKLFYIEEEVYYRHKYYNFTINTDFSDKDLFKMDETLFEGCQSQFYQPPTEMYWFKSLSLKYPDYVSCGFSVDLTTKINGTETESAKFSLVYCRTYVFDGYTIAIESSDKSSKKVYRLESVDAASQFLLYTGENETCTCTVKKTSDYLVVIDFYFPFLEWNEFMYGLKESVTCGNNEACTRYCSDETKAQCLIMSPSSPFPVVLEFKRNNDLVSLTYRNYCTLKNTSVLFALDESKFPGCVKPALSSGAYSFPDRRCEKVVFTPTPLPCSFIIKAHSTSGCEVLYGRINDTTAIYTELNCKGWNDTEVFYPGYSIYAQGGPKGYCTTRSQKETIAAIDSMLSFFNNQTMAYTDFEKRTLDGVEYDVYSNSSTVFYVNRDGYIVRYEEYYYGDPRDNTTYEYSFDDVKPDVFVVDWDKFSHQCAGGYTVPNVKPCTFFYPPKMGCAFQMDRSTTINNETLNYKLYFANDTNISLIAVEGGNYKTIIRGDLKKVYSSKGIIYPIYNGSAAGCKYDVGDNERYNATLKTLIEPYTYDKFSYTYKTEVGCGNNKQCYKYCQFDGITCITALKSNPQYVMMSEFKLNKVDVVVDTFGIPKKLSDMKSFVLEKNKYPGCETQHPNAYVEPTTSCQLGGSDSDSDSDSDDSSNHQSNVLSSASIIKVSVSVIVVAIAITLF